MMMQTWQQNWRQLDKQSLDWYTVPRVITTPIFLMLYVGPRLKSQDFGSQFLLTLSLEVHIRAGARFRSRPPSTR